MKYPRFNSPEFGVSSSTLMAFLVLALSPVASAELRIGFAKTDITPSVTADRTVWLAGYTWGRRATGVHDPLYARAIVLSDGETQVALVSVDLVGLPYPTVQRIRSKLPEFGYVLVSSTHNHEGPDTIGIWGKNPFKRGVDEQYITSLVDKTADCVRAASGDLVNVQARYGAAEDESLLGDRRRPHVKDGIVRTLSFISLQDQSMQGIVLQWNCHPESLGPKNTLVTADFPYATVAMLREKYKCPIVYFSGAVGGLMAPPGGLIKDAKGRPFREGQFAFAEAYGGRVAELAGDAIDRATEITLTPLRVSARKIAVPVRNPLYRTASVFRVVRRRPIQWTGDFNNTVTPVTVRTDKSLFATTSEVGCLRLGQLFIAAIPGEIYPELVYGRFQEPADPSADFPDAPLEKSVVQIMPNDKWMLLGLANDEIGYIIPKRQWDQEPPYAYGRTRPQYGEVNSCGSDVAAIVMQALADRVVDVLE